MEQQLSEFVAESNLREALGLSRVEMKKLRVEIPEPGRAEQRNDGQGKKPKSLWPWYWNKDAVAWLSGRIGLDKDEQRDMNDGVKILNVMVSRCNFPNKRIFEARLEDKCLMMVQCKDSTKLRPKQRVKIKFSNGRGYLVSDKSGRAR